MHIGDGDERTERDEGIVPLINIVFLLLIFFLLVGTLAPPADLDIAHVETRESPPADAPAKALYVAADGTLSHDGRRLRPGELGEALAGAKAAEQAPFPVVVDRALRADEFAPIFDALARAGIGDVRLITLRERPE